MTNELTRRVFKTIDTMRPDSITAMYADDARVVFGNAEPLVGRKAITAGIENFFATINGLRHHVVNDWRVHTDTIAEAEVTYSRTDGTNVSVPVVSIWRTGDDGLITDYRVFFDLTPVYAP
jgi:ketosteroid isomerase-like protein